MLFFMSYFKKSIQYFHLKLQWTESSFFYNKSSQILSVKFYICYKNIQNQIMNF